ncbi:hypothetical protein KY316_02735, partial [Candidatus Woesearchaeota archaeon]|nr:hypothetical protein [Candidatus Woesearchaeota archaeon]
MNKLSILMFLNILILAFGVAADCDSINWECSATSCSGEKVCDYSAFKECKEIGGTWAWYPIADCPDDGPGDGNRCEESGSWFTCESDCEG